MPTLRRHIACRGDHQQQRSSPCESPAAVCCAGRSRHEFSGQRMNMKPPPASGRASALRVNIAATSTPIFKTRQGPCRIAVRAEIKKSINCNKNRCRIAVRWTSRGVSQRRNMPFSRPILRFTDDCRLKTDDSPRSSHLRFPYGTGRCNSNELLEQMPRSGDRRASARMAFIATSLLRSSRIVTPRSHSAPAKSKPMC